MKSVTNAQNWIDAAIACGPLVCLQSDGTLALILNTVEVELERSPGIYPDELGKEIVALLDGMGRAYPQGVAS
jgi:hypothetical protein